MARRNAEKNAPQNNAQTSAQSAQNTAQNAQEAQNTQNTQETTQEAQNTAENADNALSEVIEGMNVYGQFLQALQNAESSLLYVAYWFGKCSDLEKLNAREAFKTYGWDESKVSRVCSLYPFLTEALDENGALVIGCVYGSKVRLSYTLLAEMKTKDQKQVQAMIDALPEGSIVSTCAQWRALWKQYKSDHNIKESRAPRTLGDSKGNTAGSNTAGNTTGSNTAGNTAGSTTAGSTTAGSTTAGSTTAGSESKVPDFVQKQDSETVAKNCATIRNIYTWLNNNKITDKAQIDALFDLTGLASVRASVENLWKREAEQKAEAERVAKLEKQKQEEKRKAREAEEKQKQEEQKQEVPKRTHRSNTRAKKD